MTNSIVNFFTRLYISDRIVLDDIPKSIRDEVQEKANEVNRKHKRED